MVTHTSRPHFQPKWPFPAKPLPLSDEKPSPPPAPPDFYTFGSYCMATEVGLLFPFRRFNYVIGRLSYPLCYN